MSANCQQAMAEVGNGIAASLRAVDCAASDVTAQAFGSLFAPGGSLVPVLTILLTLYVALFALALILGRGNLSVRSLMPKFITLGLVLTFGTSWAAYQGVVWNLAVATPDWLASMLTDDRGSATATFAAKIDVVFAAVQQASEGQGDDISAFSPPGMMWMGAMLLLLGTVGVLVTARIALALLIALGPIFVVLGLFNGTRGLFTGWLKGVVMLALTPLFAVLGGSVMLELAVPVLSSLSIMPGQIEPQPAMAFFMIGAVHMALMIMVLKVAGTMVAGWRVFGLVPAKDGAADTQSTTPLRSPTAAPSEAVRSMDGAATVGSGSRRISVPAAISPQAANDAGAPSGSGYGATVSRETRIVGGASAGGQVQSPNTGTSRTRGIGNRFRPAARPANVRKTEKYS